MTYQEIIFNLFLAFIGVVLALWYENLGAPRLIIEKHVTTDSQTMYGKTKFLHLKVRNNPRKMPFVPRQTAYECHGTVTFLTKNMKEVCGPMPFKWDGTPEPVKKELSEGDKRVYLFDNRLVRVCRYINIPPDEIESLAVAVRFIGEQDAFGWTPESYAKYWRHENYQLPTGEYIARVKIKSSDTVAEEDFIFINPINFDNFDLM